jgi:hypothetical protein
MTADIIITAAAAGTWRLGDLTVNRMGLGAMRVTQTGSAFAGTAENVAAGAIRFTDDELASLDALGAAGQ